MKKRLELIKRLRALDELERRRCEKSYYYFLKKAWRILEPHTPLDDNWHIKYICDYLQNEIHRIGRRQKKTKDIIINIPPRSLKSYTTSVMLCAWAWIHYPHLRFINSSHRQDLSQDHCVNSRTLMSSAWYQEKWRDRFKFTSDQNVKSYFKNDKGGYRLSTSVESGITGMGADIIIADDLMNPKKALSETERAKANFHYDKELWNRLNSPEIGLRIIVMQRLHEDDTAGHAETSLPEGYFKICIPAEISESVSPPELRAFYNNGFFFYQRFGPEVLTAARKVHGPTQYAGQYNQKISAAEGNIFMRKSFRYYSKLPDRFEYMLQSWDMSFKKGPDNSFVVGQVWGRYQGKNYLVYQYRKQAGFSETQKAIAMVTTLYPMATKKLIEEKANGSAIIDSMENKISGMVGMPKSDGKEAVWTAASGIVDGGCVYVPDPVQNPWVEDYLTELTTVPNAKFNDQADATAQALLEMEKGSIEKLKKFLGMAA